MTLGPRNGGDEVLYESSARLPEASGTCARFTGSAADAYNIDSGCPKGGQFLLANAARQLGFQAPTVALPHEPPDLGEAVVVYQALAEGPIEGVYE